MFYAALVCSVSAAVSLFSLGFAVIITASSLLILISVSVFCKKIKYITVSAFILLFLLNLILQFKNIQQIEKLDSQSVSGSFLVTDDTVEYEEFNTVELKVLRSKNIPKNIKVFAFDNRKSNLKMGDIISGNLKLNSIKIYDEYRAVDYADGIYATAKLTNVKKSGCFNYFYKTAQKIRVYITNTINTYFGYETDSFLTALTVGDKSLLSDTFLNNVKSTGVSHLIVISGMHLAVIMMTVFFVTDRMFYNKYIRCLITVGSVLFVSAVCGFGMSVIRAGTMYIFAAFASVFNRESDLLNSMCASVTAVLISSPFAVFNVSFQMSVLSTLALVWVLPFYYNLFIKKFKITSKFLKAIISTALCSVTAVIFTLPVTIKNFGFVSVVSPVTNLLVVLPVNLALGFNIIAIVISAIPPIKFLSYPLFFAAGLFSKFITVAVNAVARLPITVAVLPKSAFWWAILLIFAIIAYMYFNEFKRKGSDFRADGI